MYIWLDELLPVMTIIRMGRGLMMGVDHNRNMEWVGSSAGFYLTTQASLGRVFRDCRIKSRPRLAELGRCPVRI